MRVRLGITAPMQLTGVDEATLALPHLVEWNFDAPETHAVWLEADRPLIGASGLDAERPEEGLHTLRGELPELDAWRATVSVERDAGVRSSWTEDPRAEDDGIVTQTLVAAPAAVPGRVVIVVDGSRSMQPFLAELAGALPALPGELSVILAGDEPTAVEVGDLAALRLRGGADNVPALERAWDLASTGTDGVVLWVHGPQPVLMEQAEGLRQRWERRPEGPRMLALAVAPGPNRIVQQLDGIRGVRVSPRRGTLQDDLGDLLASWSPGHEGLVRRLERTSSGRAGTPDTRTSDHIARLWAAAEIERLAGSPATREQALELAVGYQLVTPVSGAVVLENARQYEEAGLDPAAPADVPTVPEPETWALMILMSAGLAWMARRRRQEATWTAR